MADKTVFQPMGRRVAASPKQTLLELAVSAGVGIEAACGGKGICGKCKVEPLGEASPPGPLEAKVLGAELHQGLRLACQTTMPNGGAVQVPPQSRREGQVILTDGAAVTLDFDPLVTRGETRVPPGRLREPMAHADRLSRALAGEGAQKKYSFPLAALRELPRTLEQGQGRVAAWLRAGSEVMRLAPAPGPPGLGLAVDLGSTTVVAYLYDLAEGRRLAVKAAMNPQVSYGDDVISRISHCDEDPKGLARLGSLAVECVNRLACEACAEAGVAPGDILECTMVGNTAMHHIFLGLSPTGLAQAPYLPVAAESLEFKAAELGLAFHPQAWLVWLPVMAGFVGADTVAVALAARADEIEEPTLLLDLGTNGEMILAAHGELLCCSTAAGPAFEGCHIRHGMRGAAGAVDKVAIDPADHTALCRVIGGGKAVGVCGSGLVSLLAELVDKGLVLPGGGLDRSAAPDLIKRGENGLEYLVLSGEKCAGGGEITLSAKDVSELQLAKAAVRAGVEIMMAELGVKKLSAVLLAGAFGNYLDPAAALGLGLFPPLPLGQVKGIGNAAGAGAVMALLNRGQRAKAARLARQMRYQELAAHPDFKDTYVDAMMFD